jgi:hypothetical protein
MDSSSQGSVDTTRGLALRLWPKSTIITNPQKNRMDLLFRDCS